MLTYIIAIILLFALLETPVFVIIASISMSCLFLSSMEFESLQMILIDMNRLSTMPILIALPLFTFTGCLLKASKASRRITELSTTILGDLPGGVAISCLLACVFFTTLTGASGVTIVALGGILFPILRERGYNESFSLGLLTVSGSLGLLFPPSIAVILYAIVAQVDVLTLFRAALIPGFMLILILCLYAVLYSFVHHQTPKNKPSKKSLRMWLFEGADALNQTKWEIFIVVILVAGVFGGFVTISEVAAIVSFYSIILYCFILKEIHFLNQLPKIFVEAAALSGAIIIILGFSLGLTGYLVDEEIPQTIIQWITQVSHSKVVFLAGLNLFLLLAGCVMDIFSATIIIVPLILPIAKSFQIDPIHLGIIFLVNLEIGYATPPVGINLFISSLQFKKPITTLYRASIPFLLLLIVILILVTYIPFFI